MNRGAVRAIARKDLASVVRNRGVLIPLLVTPFIVLVVMPVLLVGGVESLGRAGADLPGAAAQPFAAIGEQVTATDRIDDVADPRAQWATFVLEVFLAPLYLLVPLIVATVIAADSFAGERERGTLEALLHTATTDRELLLGKFLAAWVPAVTVSLTGFVVYSVIANALAWPALGRVFFPTPAWLLLALFVAPGIAALGLAIMVIASSRVKSLQAAHQIGSLVVLPVILLLIAQVTGVLLFGPGLVMALGVGIWVAALSLLALGASSLRRERLALRL